MSQRRRRTIEQDPMLSAGSMTDEAWDDALFSTTSAPFDAEDDGWGGSSSSAWDASGMADDLGQGFDTGIAPDALSTGHDEHEAYLLEPSGHPSASAAGDTGGGFFDGPLDQTPTGFPEQSDVDLDLFGPLDMGSFVSGPSATATISPDQPVPYTDSSTNVPTTTNESPSEKSPLVSHAQGGVLQCSICSKVISTQSKLNRHMRYHTRNLPCPHDACDGKFAQKKEVQRHIRSHHAQWAAKNPTLANLMPAEWKCKLCDYVTDRRDNLKRHTDKRQCLGRKK